MVEIKYSVELLKDFDSLILDYATFMTLNLIHADQGLTAAAQVEVKGLIKYSLEQSKTLNPFFKTPLLNYHNENKEKLLKNFKNLLDFFHKYIIFAEPILKKHKNELYNGRFSNLKIHYLDFTNKYKLN